MDDVEQAKDRDTENRLLLFGLVNESCTDQTKSSFSYEHQYCPVVYGQPNVQLTGTGHSFRFFLGVLVNTSQLQALLGWVDL
jgi:hypothetical protein